MCLYGNNDKICRMVRYVLKKKNRVKDDFRDYGWSRWSNEVSVIEIRMMVIGMMLGGIYCIKKYRSLILDMLFWFVYVLGKW